MTNTGKKTTSDKTMRMVGLSVLTAIIIVLQVLTTFFPTKPFAITLALIPIVVGAAIYGAGAGAYLGFVFSVVVVFMCIFGFDAGGAMVWNANPFLCVILCLLKGTAAGFAAGLVYNALSKANSIVATVAAAFITPIVNTGIFILGMLLFFKDVLNVWSGGTDVIYYALILMTGVNFLVELGVNMLVSPIIVRIIAAVKKNR